LKTKYYQFEKHKIYSIFVTVILIVFSLWSALWACSSFLTARAETIIIRWEQDNNKEFNKVIALEMLKKLKQSIAINPLDANTYLLIARYYDALSCNKLNDYSIHAEQAYTNAITFQPSWDYAWAKKADFYSNQPKLNQTAFMQALSQAILFGRYETKTQQVIIPLIFKHWSLLNKQKPQAIQIIKHALKFHIYANFVLQAAKKYKRLTVLSPLITKTWQKKQLREYLKEKINTKNVK
jgi:hypothetical protein